jgi:hypothetical protein
VFITGRYFTSKSFVADSEAFSNTVQNKTATHQLETLRERESVFLRHVVIEKQNSIFQAVQRLQKWDTAFSISSKRRRKWRNLSTPVM